MASSPDEVGAIVPLAPHLCCNNSADLRAVRFCLCVLCVVGITVRDCSSLLRTLCTSAPILLFTCAEGTHCCTTVLLYGMHILLSIVSYADTCESGSVDQHRITLRHVIDSSLRIAFSPNQVRGYRICTQPALTSYGTPLQESP